MKIMRLVIQSNALVRKTVGTEKLLVVAPDYWLPVNFSSRENPYGQATAYSWAGTLTSARDNSSDVYNAAYAKVSGSNPSYANTSYPHAAVEIIHIHGTQTGYEHTWRARFQGANIVYPALGSNKRCESARIYMANTSLWEVCWGWNFFTNSLGVDTTTAGPGAGDTDVLLNFDIWVGAGSEYYSFTPSDIASKNAAAGNPTVKPQVSKYNKGWIYWGPSEFTGLCEIINANKTSPIYAELYWTWGDQWAFPTCYACDITGSANQSAIATKLWTAQQPYFVLGVTDL